MTATGIEIRNSQNVLNRSFRVVVSYSEEDNVYYASVPSIEGCMTYGATLEEAMKHIKDAAEGMIAVMQEEGWEIPDDSQNIEYNLHIPLASVIA
jgi:antitoxin HicB